MPCDLTLCGRQLGPPAPLATLFRRMVTYDYYDGLVAGVAECADRNRTYRLQMLDWDTSHDTRIFSVAPLPSETFDAVVAAYAACEKPRWPDWVPTLSACSNTTREQVYTFVEEVLGSTGPVELVIALRLTTGFIVAARAVSEADRRNRDWSKWGEASRTQDWFRFVGAAV